MMHDQIEKSFKCNSCSRFYLHKRSLERHVATKHSQEKNSKEDHEHENVMHAQENFQRAFVYQFLDFWGCDLDNCPPYLTRSVHTMIRESRKLCNDQQDTLNIMFKTFGNANLNLNEELLMRVVDDMFHNHLYSWTKIITVFSLAIKFGQHATTHKQDAVYNAVPGMLLYALHKTEFWMHEEGGWDTFSYIYNPL